MCATDCLLTDNVIRENLKQRVTPRVNESGMDRTPLELLRLYEDAKIHCDRTIRNVVLIIQQNLRTDLFRYDACLVRDGCFFAAFMVAKDGTTQGTEIAGSTSQADQGRGSRRPTWRLAVYLVRRVLGKRGSTSPSPSLEMLWTGRRINAKDAARDSKGTAEHARL